MSEIIYRISSDGELEHAYVSPYQSSSYDPKARHDRYVRSKPLVSKRNQARTTNPYGNYKSPYYNPVKRREYYEAHKDHETRPYGTGGTSTGSSGSGGSRGSGRSSGSSKKSGRRGRKKASSNFSEQIAALREESSKMTAGQVEETRAKIEALRKQLSAQVKSLRTRTYDQATSSKNAAESRGIIQSLKSKIESLQTKNDKEAAQISKELQVWINQERKALESRIAAAYKQAGREYKRS